MSLVAILDHPADSISRHPVSACQPDLDAEAFAALKDSIRRFGIQQPILITLAGAVVDGWHRLQALLALGPHVQGVPCLRILSPNECEPERLAQLVDGLLRGRRHLSKRELGQQQVRIWEACGMDFRSPGRAAPTPDILAENPDQEVLYDKPRQNGGIKDNPPITAEKVAEKTGISVRTAERAIADVKAETAAKTDPNPNVSAEKRKARAAAKKTAKLSETEELRVQLRFWKETAENAGADLDEAHAIIEDRDLPDRSLEIERNRRELESARKRAQKAEAEAAYWKSYAARMETALERLNKETS